MKLLKAILLLLLTIIQIIVGALIWVLVLFGYTIYGLLHIFIYMPFRYYILRRETPTPWKWDEETPESMAVSASRSWFKLTTFKFLQ